MNIDPFSDLRTYKKNFPPNWVLIRTRHLIKSCRLMGHLQKLQNFENNEKLKLQKRLAGLI